MSRADLIAKRDAAALAFDRADAQYRGILPGALYRAGSGDAYRIREDARAARAAAQDAVDAADKALPDPGWPCPNCGGEGGRFAEDCPSITTEWIECKACEGTGEHWPEDAAS